MDALESLRRKNAMHFGQLATVCEIVMGLIDASPDLRAAAPALLDDIDSRAGTEDSLAYDPDMAEGARLLTDVFRAHLGLSASDGS